MADEEFEESVKENQTLVIESREEESQIYDDESFQYEVESSQDDFQCQAYDKVEEEERPLTGQEILSKFVSEGRSLYTHLMLLLEEIISTRPENIIDYFDQYSFVRRYSKLPDEHSESYLESANRLTNLFQELKNPLQSFEEMEEEETERLLKTNVDIVDFVDYFEDMDTGLPKWEAYQISLAVRYLSQKPIIRKARFWGKILGLDKSYIIAECDLEYEELMKRKLQAIATWNRPEDEGMHVEETHLLAPPVIDAIPKLFNQPVLRGEGGYEGDYDWTLDSKVRKYPKLYAYQPPPFPVPTVPVTIKTKSEFPGEGTNKKAYFVCNEPGEEWFSLPDVTPEQIVTARQIKSYFHGYLFRELETYPTFPGQEREYLRAQIARISAGTQISPLGFYRFGAGGEGAEMESEGAEAEIVPNLEYDPIPYQDLLQKDFWVHHTPHILELGRNTWWDPNIDAIDEEMGEEEVIREEAVEQHIEPEIGPPLLTPLSEDLYQEGLDPWTIRGTSQIVPGTGVIGVRSNLWPGAFAFSKGRLFENVYVGWGLKHSVHGFSPYKQPMYQNEYELGPEIMEIDDPSPELEKEWAEAHKPPPIFPGEGGEHGESRPHSPIYEEESEVEDADDDDD